ncbi:MAG: cytochrome c [Candidatus Hydrogenedentes bacterium]|nr:cytochrome c [Candidatus Hydrogenedentota bacterium]
MTTQQHSIARAVNRVAAFFTLALVLVLTSGCHQDMWNQAKYKPLAKSTFFADGLASRPQVPGVVPAGYGARDTLLYTGKVDGQLANSFPEELPVTRELILRGQQRFEIYCTPCHGRLGDGNGMIVQRGFKRPPSYHTDRLRAVPVGYFFDVMTNGFGTMYSYASRVPVKDRWAIAAYIRTLQYSQFAPETDMAPQDLALLDQPVQGLALLDKSEAKTTEGSAHHE